MENPNSYLINFILKDKSLYSRAILSQERWRQKQIDIYYRTGRPIFNIDKHKMEFFAKF